MNFNHKILYDCFKIIIIFETQLPHHNIKNLNQFRLKMCLPVVVLAYCLLKGPSTKDVRQMGWRWFQNFGHSWTWGGGWFVKVRTSENF